MIPSKLVPYITVDGCEILTKRMELKPQKNILCLPINATRDTTGPGHALFNNVDPMLPFSVPWKPGK